MAELSNTPHLIPAYLVVGEDHLKRDTVLSRLRARLASMGDIAFNSDTFDGATCSGEEVVAACNTIPFASPYRLVEVKAADKLKKADQEALVTYLAKPASCSILVLVADKLAKNTRLYKAVQALGTKAVIDCAPAKPSDMPKLVRSMAVSHGITITPDAAERLVALVGTDTIHLNEELKKLALSHTGNDPVNETEITSMVSQTAEVKWWDFVDAVSERNLPKVLAIRAKMPGSTPYELLPRCVSRMRELMCVRALTKRGATSQIATELNIPTKLAWKVKNYRNWARNYSEEEFRRALVGARIAEQKMKSGTDPDTAFIDWLVAFIRK